jgi:outer membrane protein, multidrug efflux system
MKPLSLISPLARVVRALAPVGLLALVGCTVGPDFHPPTVQTPANWVDANQPARAATASHLAPSPVTAVDWWTQFGDDELNKLVRAAAAENLGVLQAEAQIRASRAAVSEVNAGLFPGVSGSGSYTRRGAPDIPTTGSFAAGLDAAWELDIFGGTRRSVESAQASLGMIIEDRRDTLITLVAEVGVDYINLRSEQQLLEIAHKSLDDEQHTLKITQDRWQAGLASKLDYENAKSAADSTLSEIPPLEAAIRTEIYALSLLLSRDPAALLDELTPAAPLPKSPDQVPIGLPAELLRRRPDIRAAEEQLHADTANIGVAIAQYYPQFSLSGSLNFQGSSLGQLSQWASRSWSWGPSFNWEILEGGRLSAQVEQAKAVLQADLFSYHNTVLTALNEAETALVSFTTEQEHGAALRAVEDDNQQAYDLSLQLYTQGQIEFINVLSAELSLVSSKNQVEQSDAAVATDLVALFKALGGGWSEFPERDANLLEYGDGAPDAPPVMKSTYRPGPNNNVAVPN